MISPAKTAESRDTERYNRVGQEVADRMNGYFGCQVITVQGEPSDGEPSGQDLGADSPVGEKALSEEERESLKHYEAQIKANNNVWIDIAEALV
jgi:hypothetical protein